MILPTDAKARKAIPIFSGCIRYFPDALAAVADLSRIGNEQHHPGKPLHWDRAKSTDELDALTRHLVDAGTIDTDGVRHSTKVAWRALANLQKEIEKAAKDSDPLNVALAEINAGPPALCATAAENAHIEGDDVSEPVQHVPLAGCGCGQCEDARKQFHAPCGYYTTGINPGGKCERCGADYKNPWTPGGFKPPAECKGGRECSTCGASGGRHTLNCPTI